MSRFAKAILVTYWIIAANVLVFFWLAPPDGLSNIWIALFSLPVTALLIPVLDWQLGISFPFLPFDYYIAHTLYFLGAVCVISILIAAIGRRKRS